MRAIRHENKGTAVLASQIELLLRIIDEGYNKKAWHGPNLRGAIKRVAFAQAAWRPAPERHNVWEHVVHAAYWKYILRRRLLGEKKGSFAWVSDETMATRAAAESWRAGRVASVTDDVRGGTARTGRVGAH